MQTFRCVGRTEQMYHQQQLQSHSQHLPSRSLPREKQFLLQGGDSGLVLSTDAKPRLKWTNELHERFVEAVNQLGGPDKATPKTIMRLMGIPGLTLYHLKSHLQKYRLSKNLQAQATAIHARNVPSCTSATYGPCEGNGSPASQMNLEAQTSKPVHISEALQMQIEVQRRLHDQIEVQRHLQLRIEAQGKYLQSVLEKAQEALQKQSLAAAGNAFGLAATKTRPSGSELVSSSSMHQQREREREHGGGGGSVDSCLTACECSGSGSHRGDHDMLSIGLSAARRPGSGSGTSRRSSSSSGEHRGWRQIVTGDDGFSGPRFHPAAGLDLNINDGNNKIDLNGSGWS